LMAGLLRHRRQGIKMDTMRIATQLGYSFRAHRRKGVGRSVGSSSRWRSSWDRGAAGAFSVTWFGHASSPDGRARRAEAGHRRAASGIVQIAPAAALPGSKNRQGAAPSEAPPGAGRRGGHGGPRLRERTGGADPRENSRYETPARGMADERDGSEYRGDLAQSGVTGGYAHGAHGSTGQRLAARAMQAARGRGRGSEGRPRAPL